MTSSALLGCLQSKGTGRRLGILPRYRLILHDCFFYLLSCLILLSFQYVNAVEASRYDSRLKKKNKERKEKIQLLTAELTATKQHSQITEARRKTGRKKDAEEIEKLKAELAKHQEDAAIISDLRAQLEEHAKDTSRIEELETDLARAEKSKKEVDEKLASIQSECARKIAEADKAVSSLERELQELKTSSVPEVASLKADVERRESLIASLKEALAKSKEENGSLQSRVAELQEKMKTAVKDYFESEQGQNDMNQFALWNVRPFSRLLSAKFPSRQGSLLEASQKLMDQHYSQWFWPLPDSKFDVKFEGCTEFAKYWLPEEGSPPPSPELAAEDPPEEEGSATSEDSAPDEDI